MPSVVQQGLAVAAWWGGMDSGWLHGMLGDGACLPHEPAGNGGMAVVHGWQQMSAYQKEHGQRHVTVIPPCELLLHQKRCLQAVKHDLSALPLQACHVCVTEAEHNGKADKASQLELLLPAIC